MTHWPSKGMLLGCVILAAVAVCASEASAASDGTPHAVDTTGLESIGDEWLAENPYRSNETAIQIGSSGYNQNCARCHGLDGISGGLAPDLRFLESGAEGDEWFLEMTRGGYTQNGITKMPGFEGVLSQEAMWAIRSWLETKYAE